MKSIKLISVVVIIVALNNLGLLYLLGYFSDEPKIDSPTITSSDNNQYLDSQMVALEPAVKAVGSEKTKPISHQPEYFGTENDYQFMETLQRVAQSQEFIDLLDEHQRQASLRQLEINKRLADMSVTELYEIAMNSSVRMEKQVAISYLQDNKMNRLSVDQLKDLYLDSTFKVHGKNQIIIALVKKDDIEGIEWAKQGLLDSTISRYYVGDLLPKIYQHDPDFIKEIIANVDFENGRNVSSIANFAVEQPALATEFVNKHFDDLIASSELAFLLSRENVKEFEMSLDQQQKVIDAYKANEDKRGYAYLGLLGRIDDVQVLRNLYPELKTEQDRVAFVHDLLRSKMSEQHVELAKELGKDLDDVYLQSILRQ